MKMLGTIGQMNTIEFNQMLYVEPTPEDRKFNVNDIKSNIEVDPVSGKIKEEIYNEEGQLVDFEGNRINQFGY